jgi:uncharacterized protein YggE
MRISESTAAAADRYKPNANADVKWPFGTLYALSILRSSTQIASSSETSFTYVILDVFGSPALAVWRVITKLGSVIMSCRLCLVAAVIAFSCLLLSQASAQLAGARGGVDPQSSGVADLPLLDRQTAETYVAIDGRAEVRLRATEIRIVLAITGEGETAEACRAAVDITVARLREAWSEIGVADDRIVVDFIAVLPRYAWHIEEQGGVDIGVEELVGYRMQMNVHLAVPDETRAMKVLAAAFKENVTDIIGFDYFSNSLDDAKARARLAAVNAARSKADVLLSQVFDERPRPINLQEETIVRYPESLYHSFTNAVAESMSTPYRRDIPLIRSPRPQNTYYRGLESNADVQPPELPMRPEISVVSTVRIYYESPAAKRAEAEDDNGE